MNEQSISAGVLSQFPAVDETRVDALLQNELAASRAKLVVLDDDPTGVQTVHDVSVYTDWSVERLREGFGEAGRLFFILTNSRSFTAAQTVDAHREIARNVLRVSRESGVPYLLVSRGDSTLRGHYPLETETLRRETEACGGEAVDGEILCPYFKEGGRFTIGNVHYVRSGDWLVPAGETEFAGDRTFGYRASDLREYVEEKTGGVYRAQDVRTISLDELRGGDVNGIAAKLCAVSGFGKVVVNAVDDCDVKVFCVALYRAVAAGKRFILRCAAGLVKILGGISDRALLTRARWCGGRPDSAGSSSWEAIRGRLPNSLGRCLPCRASWASRSARTPCSTATRRFGMRPRASPGHASRSCAAENRRVLYPPRRAVRRGREPRGRAAAVGQNLRGRVRDRRGAAGRARVYRRQGRHHLQRRGD